MANTKIPSELSSTPSISDSGDATAITIDSSENVAVTGNLSAAKLISNNGILELDDNGSHNGIINVPASLSINIDSDNGATTESFTISKDKTAINDTDVLFRVLENGNVGIGGTPITTYSGYDGASLHVQQSGTGSSVGSQVRLTSGSSGHAAGDGSYIAHWGDSDLYIANQENANIKFYTNGSERMRIDVDGDLLIGQTSNQTNAKVNIGASNGIPLTIGSDQYGGSGTVTFFTESIEGKTASNTHTVTIAFTSQSSRWTSHLVETHFAGSRDNATSVYAGRSVYTFSTLTGFANISELEDIGTNVSMSANDSGMNLVITISASSVASYQVMVKVISSFGNARPYSISVT